MIRIVDQYTQALETRILGINLSATGLLDANLCRRDMLIQIISSKKKIPPRSSPALNNFPPPPTPTTNSNLTVTHLYLNKPSIMAFMAAQSPALNPPWISSVSSTNAQAGITAATLASYPGFLSVSKSGTSRTTTRKMMHGVSTLSLRYR